MKTILIPVDFTDVSDNAINYAAEFAKIYEAKLILFHAYQLPVMTSDTPLIIPSMEDLEKDCMDGLRKIESRINMQSNATVITECKCVCGIEVDEIDEFIKEHNVNLVITGMHSGGELTEKLIGSTATSLMRNLKCPVLAIDAEVKFSPIKKIALACDFKEIKNVSAFNSLKEIVNLFQSHLFIINVLKNKNDLIPDTNQAVAGIKLEHILEEIPHSFHFEENPNVVEGINSFAAAHAIDLVVMIPRSHSLLHNIFHEPSTKRMAFHTHLPLMSIPE